MAQTREYTLTVLYIKRYSKQGKDTLATTSVKEQYPDISVKDSSTYDLGGFRLLSGAKSVLRDLQDKRMDDEEDKTCFNCLGSVRSYITSYFAGIVPAKNSNCIDNVPQRRRASLASDTPLVPLKLPSILPIQTSTDHFMTMQPVLPKQPSMPSSKPGNYIYMRCFVFEVVSTKATVYARVLAEVETDKDWTILRLCNRDWKYIEDLWGEELRNHIGDSAYKTAHQISRAETKDELVIFRAKQKLCDLVVSPEYCNILSEKGELRIPKLEDVSRKRWMMEEKHSISFEEMWG